MYCTTEERKRLQDEFTAAARQEIAHFIEWMTQSEGVPSLEVLEGEVQKIVFRLGLDLLHGALELIGPGYQTEGPQCEGCGDTMEFERYQGKEVLTLLGPLRVRRAYYTCSSCHSGKAPLDEVLGLDHTGLSRGLQKVFCQVVGRMSFAEASEMLASLNYPEVPETTARRLTLAVGQELQQQQEQRKAKRPTTSYGGLGGTEAVVHFDGWDHGTFDRRVEGNAPGGCL